MRLALIFGIILAILAVIFAFENPGFTQITVAGNDYQILTAALLIAAFGIGALIGMLLTLPSGWRHRRRVRVLERQLAERGTPVVERTIVEEPAPSTRRGLHL